jgi:catechol 2,3-dioxygenase-like lactoylglutathione lyase family enzyme
MSSPVALWLPYQVRELEAAIGFYTDRLGLSEVDSWRREGERGVVLKVADAAYLELVSAPADRIEPIAVEFADAPALAAVHAGFGTVAAPVSRYPRGHHGFTVTGPAGVRLMLWREKQS